MLKRKRLLALVVAATLAIPSPASAFQYHEPAYFTTLYSDGTYTTVVGHLWPSCGPGYVQYYLEGTYSIYGIDELVGYCGPNGWEPI
jgi:hypothetical protein